MIGRATIGTIKIETKVMLSNIERFIEYNNLIERQAKIVVGLSGGPDSVFLLHLLAHKQRQGEIKTLIAAHLDHEWREDSGKDAKFCRKLASSYNVEFVDSKLSELAISLKFNGSKEEFGRRARRFFFETLCKKHNLDLIALAHHAQDQQETFFIRLLRGATLTGLTGMKPKNGSYIRPLLETNKKDIISFLKKENIPYITDPTNESEQFLRNKIRKHVLPALKKCDERFDTKFKETLESLRKTETYLQKETTKIFKEITIQNKIGRCINTEKLFALDSVAQNRVLLFWLCTENIQFPVSKGFFSELLRFLKQPSGGSHKCCPDWSIIKKKGISWISKSSL